MQPQLDFYKDLAIILGGFVALVTLLSGVFEFVRQGRQHRVTRFLEMRRRFLETGSFREILNLLNVDSPELEGISIQDRRHFAGFLEEVALMVNSRLISKSIAYYMFGDYVLLTANSEHFWHGLDRNSVYWTVFRQYADTMRVLEKDGRELSNLPRF